MGYLRNQAYDKAKGSMNIWRSYVYDSWGENPGFPSASCIVKHSKIRTIDRVSSAKKFDTEIVPFSIFRLEIFNWNPLRVFVSMLIGARARLKKNTANIDFLSNFGVLHTPIVSILLIRIQYRVCLSI